MRSATLFLTLVTSASLCLVTSVPAAEWIVAADGSGQFTKIQQAVDAAQSGDLIWVMPGTYGKTSVGQKAISIIGAGADNTVVTSVHVDAAPIGYCVVSGMTITVYTRITTSAATIVLRDCSGGALDLAGCDQVFIENWHGGAGTSAGVASLRITSSTFKGGDGVDAVPSGVPGSWSQVQTRGSAGFSASESAVYATLSDFTGGCGGQGSCSSANGLLLGAAGGNGLEDETGDCSFSIAKCTLTPGAGGEGGPQCAPTSGATGLLSKAGTKVLWDEQGDDLFPLSIETPSKLGSKTTIGIWGHPDDTVLLLIGAYPATVSYDGIAGFPFGLDLNAGFINFWPLTRTIEDDGDLTWTHIIPFDPLLLGTPVFVQALLQAPAGSPYHPPALTGVSVSLIAE